MIIVLRQTQERCRDQSVGQYAAFVDLTKAFDSVSHDGLWKILERLGCPQNFLTILRQLREGQQGQVKYKGSPSGSFSISNGVKQGCLLAPTLFSIFFSIMLRETKMNLPDGIHIRYRRQSLQPSACPRTHKNHWETHHCCLLITAPFSPTQKKPYRTSSNASPTQPRTSVSPSASRRLRCCTNSFHDRRAALLGSASMAPTWTQWSTLLTWIASSPTMPLSARILTTAFQSRQFLWKHVKKSVA